MNGSIQEKTEAMTEAEQILLGEAGGECEDRYEEERSPNA